MRFSRRRSQSGFTLLEVLLAIGISLTIGAVALTEMRRDNESQQAKAVGQQLASVGAALNTYMALQYDNIVDLSDQPGPGPGAVDDPAPRYCTPNVTTIDGNPVAICTVTIETLMRSGTLPRNFSGRNAFGAGYDLYIRVIGTGPTPIVDGLVMVNQPYTTGGSTPRYELMGQAMQEAGADSGMTRTLANSMEGLNGTWRDDAWPGVTHGGRTYTGVNRLGLLGYRVGYGSSAFAAFLRRDGTLEMTGNLNMDNHNIDHVRGLDAQFVRISQPPVGSPGLPGEGLALNSEDGTEPTRTAFVASDGGLAIRNRDGVSIQELSGDPGKLSAGEITASGNMTLNGDITVSGNIQAQDIRGRAAQLDDFIRVGATGAPGGEVVTIQNGRIEAGGDITTNSGTVRGNVGQFNRVNVGTGIHQYSLTTSGLNLNGRPSWFYDTTAAAWRVGGSTGANIVADGEIRGGSLRSDNQIVAGGVIEVEGSYGSSTVTVGSSCSAGTAAGKMRRATNGDLVQCINDKWSVMGVRTTIATATTPTQVAGGQSTTTANCPANTTLVGGGHTLTSAPIQPAPGGLDSTSPSSSFPNGNGWSVTMGRDTGAGARFQVRAICAY